MATRTATMMACDNPKCTKEFEHFRDDPAPGYHLKGGGVYLGGGAPIPKVYACSKECLTPAILDRIDEENGWGDYRG